MTGRRGRWAWLVALGGVLLGSCDPGPPLPQIQRLRVWRPSRHGPPRPWPVRIDGRGLATSTDHPLRFELLRVQPPWPRTRVALRRVTLAGDHATAEIPTGIAPGVYRLVVARGAQRRLARHRVTVRRQRGTLTVAPRAPPAAPTRGWSGGLLLAVLLGGGLGAWRFARPRAVQRRALWVYGVFFLLCLGLAAALV